MTSWEIILIIVGTPLALMVLLGLLTVAPSFVRARSGRYHPGRPWHHPPVWWTAEPETLRVHQSGIHQHNQPAKGTPYGGCRGDW